MKRTRQANLELLRLLAMVFVVTAHLMNHGNLIGAAKMGTASYYLVWTLFGVSFTCINLYLLISSYFLTESRFSLWKLVKMAVQVLFYALGITAIYWIFTDVPHDLELSLIHISEPTRLGMISYAVFCLKKKHLYTSPRPRDRQKSRMPSSA